MAEYLVDAELLVELERQKLEAMKELAYGASHEINNPLANIAARAQNLLRDEPSPERRRSLEAIHQQAMRAHEMISDLMLFARPPALELEEVDLVDIAHEAVSALEKDLDRLQIRVTLRNADRNICLRGDRQQLLVAIGALLRNSIESIGTDGTIVIEACEEAASERVSLSIEDSGRGISADVREHLFDPFYSGREAGRGLGFGLSKCWRIVTDHGGSVVVDDLPTEGARITIVLPQLRESGLGSDS